MVVSLKEIARRANVSIAAVSLAMNNKPGVGNETRERILKIAKELEYNDNRHDSSISSSRGTIRFLKIATHGHTVNRDHDVFIADYIEGLARAAKLNNYSLEVGSFIRAPIEEIVNSIKNVNLAGAIILGTELDYEDIKIIGNININIVFIDTYYDFLDYDFIDMNNIDAVFKICSYLVENGHKEIGFVRSGVHTHNFELREHGLQSAIKNLGINVKESDIYTVDSTFNGAYSDMMSYLKHRSKMPSALVCTNDIMACGCLKALREYGISVPQEISVVGFDDLPLASFTDPPLTTMQVSKREIGSLAIDRLVSRITYGKSVPPVKIQVSGSLKIRSSVRNLLESPKSHTNPDFDN
ncbi:MAG: LacI family DNA-binding transcriptional regulator [Rectinema subterraneum]|uniref:LacI family DNA-binding transcriptional regulator n=1 Tax=Rectinema subterraneum TaxID=2653714 RepID=UPI003C7B74F0